MFPTAEARVARVLSGFEVLERLGSGGVGQVFLARSPGGKRVAIKVLSDGVPREEAQSETLAREASLCVRLNHPAIVQVRALVESEGLTAVVFEYVEGVALVRLLRFCAAHGVRLPDRAACHVVERVLAALAYAHAQRDEQLRPSPIVHRDVSPANVLVDWEGGVKLGDFGMATMLGVSPATRVGLIKGTLGCMAPEQARGERVTERADVYAAALLAWRLLTGRTPFARFKNDEMELLRAMRNPRLRPLSALRPDLPEPLLDGIARALVADPEERTISAEELRVIVKANADCAGGQAELAELLNRWKPALRKTVVRERDDASDPSREPHTARYEDVALAFTDDALLDSPTVETFSLPSDAALLAAVPVDVDVSPPLPPVLPPAEGEAVDRISASPPSRRVLDSTFVPPPASAFDVVDGVAHDRSPSSEDARASQRMAHATMVVGDGVSGERLSGAPLVRTRWTRIAAAIAAMRAPTWVTVLLVAAGIVSAVLVLMFVS